MTVMLFIALFFGALTLIAGAVAAVLWGVLSNHPTPSLSGMLGVLAFALNAAGLGLAATAICLAVAGVLWVLGV